jgi:hypothetical protein
MIARVAGHVVVDDIPWWIALPLAAVLWAAYFIIVRVQDSREQRRG